MLKSLYSKMLAWLLLNLLLIALVGGGFVFFVLFSNTYGLVPASLFSSNVENVFRVLSTELQYRSTQEWSAIVKAYDRPGLQFHLVSLDDPWLYFAGDFVPLAILETAQRIPRTPFTLCPDPSKVFRGSEDYQTETGLAPTPPAIFARQGSPTGYWYARTLFVPDANHEAHYLLLAVESDDFTGQGLFFNFRLALFVALNLEWFLTGFLFNERQPQDYKIVIVLVQAGGVYLVWCLANWAVCTLIEGKGRWKEILCMTAYALIPLIVALYGWVLLSNVLTLSESGFMSLLLWVGILWSGSLLLVGLAAIHQFSFGKTVLSVLLTLLAIAIILFLLTLFYGLIQQLVSFVSLIYSEIRMMQ